MECNKEEAFRAKRMAEKKMEGKDFLRARKIAIRAQKLYPELENISQLIMVCDVHCSAESKIHGTEMDWYGILKVEPTADDLLIRKQSRKFGLLLHPDNNKCPGAADAFKVIGEAQSVLLDQGKRWIYDMKCKSSDVPQGSKPNERCGDVSTNCNQKRKADQIPQPCGKMNEKKRKQVFESNKSCNGSRQTFWTACPFCSTKYQYYRDVVLNQNLCCQRCRKRFTAYEVLFPHFS